MSGVTSTTASGNRSATVASDRTAYSRIDRSSSSRSASRSTAVSPDRLDGSHRVVPHCLFVSVDQRPQRVGLQQPGGDCGELSVAVDAIVWWALVEGW
jgi:hypothetical protein